MPDYTGNTFEDINPQYPEDTELAGYHAAAMRQVKRFLTQPEGLEATITKWINSESDNPIIDALNKLVRIPEIGEIYLTMDNSFNPNDEENQLYFNGVWEKISGRLLISTGTITAYTPDATNISPDTYRIEADYINGNSKRLTSGVDTNDSNVRWFHFISQGSADWYGYYNCYTAIQIPYTGTQTISLSYSLKLDELNTKIGTGIPVRISFLASGELAPNAGVELKKITLGSKTNVSGYPYEVSGSSDITFSGSNNGWLIATYNCDSPTQILVSTVSAGGNIIASAMSARIAMSFTDSYDVVADALYQESIPFIGVNIWVKTNEAL